MCYTSTAKYLKSLSMLFTGYLVKTFIFLITENGIVTEETLQKLSGNDNRLLKKYLLEYFLNLTAFDWEQTEVTAVLGTINAFLTARSAYEADKAKTAYYAICCENSKGDAGPRPPVEEAVIG